MAGMYEANQPMKVQELGDTIFVAESLKTPFGRLLKRGEKPKQMLAQWPVQKYPDRAFDGTLDGYDIDTFNSTTRDQMEAYSMWLMTEGWMASKLANVTRTAGVKKSEEAKQRADDAIVLAHMMEKQLLSNVDTRAEASPTDAYRSRGIFSWLSTTAQGVKPVPAAYRPPADAKYDGALASFKPSNMESMLEAAATEKKGPVDLTGYVGIKLKTQMSTWVQRDTDVSATIQNLNSTNINAADKKLIRVVDFFQFDAGMVRTMPSWYLHCGETDGATTDYTTRSGVFLDMKMLELCYMQQPASYTCPPESGGPRGYHDVIYILKMLNPLGMCYVETDS